MAELKSITHITEEQNANGGVINLAFYQMNNSAEDLSQNNTAVKKEVAEVELTGKEKKKRKTNIIKNLLVVSFGFLLLFTAFQSLSNLQSSINSDKGLGTASLSVIYAALVVSCMFVPTFMIQLLTLKYTLIVSMLMYSTYFAANFYSSWETLIPTSVVLGLGGAPLWTAKCAYLTQVAGDYAKITGESVEVLVTRFFGVFFMIFQSGQVWGNLIAYKVLEPEESSPVNKTVLSTCGAHFCVAESSTNNTNLERPPDSKVYLLCGIYTSCAVLAALFIFIFLDPLKRAKKTGSSKSRPSLGLLVETLKHLRNPYQMLIVPLTIFSGLEQAYIVGDYTQAFVSCSWGIHNVGYVMICFGVADALGSLLFGHLSKIFGRVAIFILAAIGNITIIATMFMWTPDPEYKFVFFIISGVWGLGDAVWQTQINALYGVLFPNNEEAAFANYRLWESLGFIIAFAYSSSLCIATKLYILLAVLSVGMTAYLTIEIKLRYAKQIEKTSKAEDSNSCDVQKTDK